MSTTDTRADTAYAVARARVDRQVRQIQGLLERHAAEQTKTPKHWTHVGSLNHVAEELNNVIEFLGGAKEVAS